MYYMMLLLLLLLLVVAGAWLHPPQVSRSYAHNA